MLHLRTAIPSDASAIQDILNEAFKRTEVPAINPEYFENPNCTTLVFVDNEKVLGTASVHYLQKLDRMMAQIEDVSIASSHQGKQLGKKLVQELIAHAIERGAYKIILNTTLENLSFYEKIGFKQAEIQMKITP